MFDEILTDETKRLKTIIFENALSVAWLKEANKDLLALNIEEVADEESKVNARVAELQAITAPVKRIITEEDLKTNEGLDKDVKVGDEVELAPINLNDEQIKEKQELVEKSGNLKGKIEGWYGVTNQMKSLYARIKEASWNLDNINYDLTEIVKEGKALGDDK